MHMVRKLSLLRYQGYWGHAAGGEGITPGADIRRLAAERADDGADVGAVLIRMVDRLGQEDSDAHGENLVATIRLTQPLFVPVADEERIQHPRQLGCALCQY